MSTNNEQRLQLQLDEANLKIAALKQYIQVLRDQLPVVWIDSEVAHILGNGGNTVGMWSQNKVVDTDMPLYAAPMPAPEGWKLVPIEPTEEMLDVYQTWIREGLQHMDIGIIRAIIEAAPKEPS